MSGVLPHNREAEESVLGGILLNPQEGLSKVIEVLGEDGADDFYVPAYQDIFNGMIQLYRQRTAIDIITLEEKLRTNDKLQRVGGITFLAELTTKVPTTQNIHFHANIVKDKATLRRLIQAAAEISAEANSDQPDVDQFLDDAEHKIFMLTERSARKAYEHIKSILFGTFAAIEKRADQQGAVPGVPSGFPEFDRLTAGFQPADLIIVAARPSVGKTALCLNIAQTVAIQYKIPVLIFSLEMSKESLIERILCSEARVDSTKLKHGQKLDPEEWNRLTSAASRLSEAPIWIDDSGSPSILEIRAKTRRFRSDRTIFTEPDQLGLVVVDYLQLVHAPRMIEAREQQVAAVSRGLKALAKEVRLPVVALSQLSRKVEDGKEREPVLSDLRESGAIEQDADLIAFIHRSAEDKANGTARLLLRKHRNGPCGDVDLVFLNHYTRFESLARNG